MLKIPDDSDIVLVGEYKNAKTPVKVNCVEGHQWMVIPSNFHSRGTGNHCPVCTGKETEIIDGVYVILKKKQNTKFLEEVKAIDPSLTVLDTYTGQHQYVRLQCVHGHIWKALATNILTRGTDRTCGICTPKIGGPKPLSIEQVQNTLPPYLTINTYTNTTVPFTVIDSRCGHSTEVWYSNITHKGMYKCSVCNPSLSNQERELRDFITENCPDEWIIYNDRTILEGKELDIVLPDRGLAFEYNGSYWHSDAKVQPSYHIEKSNAVRDFGYKLIHIDEVYWTNRQDIVKSRILRQLGKSEKIYARKTILKEILFPRTFLDTNHIQGAGSPTTYNYGLYYEEELVAVMTFSRPRFTKEYPFELVRYCSKLGTSVVGGASKLLKAFGQIGIVTYADRRFSEGNLYEKLGFKLSHSSAPGYYYYKSGKYLSRYQCQKHLLEKLVPEHFSPELSESEIMRNAGFNKVYDAGNLVYTLT